MGKKKSSSVFLLFVTEKLHGLLLKKEKKTEKSRWGRKHGIKLQPGLDLSDVGNVTVHHLCLVKNSVLYGER